MTNYAKWDRILRELEEDDTEDDTRFFSSKPKSEQFPPLSYKPFQLKQEIHEAAEKLHKLGKDLAEYEELGKVVKDVPLKLDHDIMVPLGKQAFIPGKIVHANEILAHLGGEHFAKKTASETYDMVERKKKNLTKQIERQETWLKSLHEKLGDVDHVLQLKKIYEDAKIQEIKETEEESNEVFDASEFTQEDYDTYFEIEKQEAEKLASSAWDWDEAMRRLEELEQNEDGDATEETVSAIQVKMNEADQVKQQGNAAFASGNYSSALELYTKAIDLAPTSHVNDSMIWLVHGNAM
ncbi:hypothetical protein AeMF1_007562 [Aphanomyces euteiches]|nr:hypothetical protein AeMF1_007562 [Aphanomyces euteiches]